MLSDLARPEAFCPQRLKHAASLRACSHRSALPNPARPPLSLSQSVQWQLNNPSSCEKPRINQSSGITAIQTWRKRPRVQIEIKVGLGPAQR